MTNNRGFSFVELIVSIAVMSIVGSLVAVFLIVSTKSYSKTSVGTDMQEDAQITLAQLTNYVIDADQSIDYKLLENEAAAGTSVLNDGLYAGTIDNISVKKLILYRNDELGNAVETITWRKDKKTVSLSREITDATTGNVVSTVTDELLAKNISAFSVDLTEVAGKQKVAMSIEFTSNNISYQASNIVNLRNKITADLVQKPDEYESVVSSVLNVKINPSKKTLSLGERQTFQAIVYGTNNPSQKVTWELSGSTVSTLDANGVLRVSTGETADTLYVTAKSVQDPTKYATATITIRVTPK